ncbi:sialate O-acetylesterase [Botrimarina mediterranea]|uniref:Sialate O-acetylesterase domain-containing protein n=1 Tax=Botrimarina mediterranea TaxID=2528022 RepID=A0A518KAR1_9BACT|nr:sialate O-acetylesterase [Botrimarina mediterranea]QDV74879.1 hypothetical protein Spa11_30880 [Botrimarina mediterranea]QDV79522.1 hypothetical protein K2D_31370 [Planctomycetes bacterium K2D]
MRLTPVVCSLLLALVATCVATAEVRLPFLFTHHMVLQRDQPAPVWGKAAAGETVTVRFGNQEQVATADESGKWSVTLDPLSLGRPRELTVTGSETDEPVVVRDVLVGDVWICSGQSNMEWSIENSKDGDLDLTAANRRRIRLLQVNQMGSPTPLDDVDQAWSVANRESVKSFSAVGYHFGVQLQQSLHVPIGLIRNAWGGSSCETWVPLDKLQDAAMYGPLLERWKKVEGEHDEAALRADYATKLAGFYEQRDAAYAAGKPSGRAPWVDNPLFHQHRPANLYNARVLPIVPFAIKGVIWYQGESNAGRAYQYRDLFPRMITSWREAWGQGDFPFYWVQLADFTPETADPVKGSDWAELREAQTMTIDAVPNAGEAVIIDIGEANDIHPRNKREVGLRLARLALADTYGKKIKAASPRYESLSIDGEKATVTIGDVGDGLKTFDGVAPRGFTIAGEDQVFHAAAAEIVDKSKVVVHSDAVPNPVAVRYGWANNPVVNVFDSAWLPLTPFRTDDWPGVTAEAR